MGTIAKQSLWNTIWLYAGMLLGYINVIILFQKFLTAEQFGVTRVLTATQISLLGSDSAIIKFFPFFRNEEKKHHGFLLVMFGVSAIGTLLVAVALILLRDGITSFYIEKSSLFVDYYYLIIPMTVFLVAQQILSLYLVANYKSVFQTFVREVFIRLIHAALLFAYYYQLINFHSFVFLFVLSYAVSSIILVIYTFFIGQLHLKPNLAVFTKDKTKEIADYSLFTILSGISGKLTSNIDILMIGALCTNGLSDVSLYVICLYISTVITIPGRSIGMVSIAAISDAWKKNDLELINKIYHKTSLNQILFGFLIFILLWINIDNIFNIIPQKYEAGKYIVLFLGLGKLFDTSLGLNGGIINTSKYYRYTTYFLLVMAIFIAVSNLMLIPFYQVKGAAIATALTLFVFNILKLVFLWHKFKIQPFRLNTLWLLLIGLVVLSLNYWLPTFQNIYIDIIVRSSFISLAYILPVYYFKISSDLNILLNKIKKPKSKYPSV